MKAKKSKISKLKIIILCVIACLAIVYIGMFSYINNLYPQSKRVVYGYGKTFVTQKAEFKIKNTKVLGMSDITKNKELFELLKEENDITTDDEVHIVLMDLVVKNPTKKSIDVDLTAFHLEAGAFSLQFYYPLMKFYNDFGMYITLNKGEEKTVTVPVPILDVHFSEYNYENVINKDFYLVWELYPEKKMAEVELKNA